MDGRDIGIEEGRMEEWVGEGIQELKKGESKKEGGKDGRRDAGMDRSVENFDGMDRRPEKGKREGRTDWKRNGRRKRTMELSA